MNRTQHILASGLITAVAAWVFLVSYTRQPEQAFLFPRLIATVFLALALWTFGKALLGLSKAGDGMSATMAARLAPGLIVAGVHVFWAARTLGFYTASGLAFLLLATIYDPASHRRPATWIGRIFAAALFTGIMYGLFAVALKLHTPRGLFV